MTCYKYLRGFVREKRIIVVASYQSPLRVERDLLMTVYSNFSWRSVIQFQCRSVDADVCPELLFNASCMWCSHLSAAWCVTGNGLCRAIRAGCPLPPSLFLRFLLVGAPRREFLLLSFVSSASSFLFSFLSSNNLPSSLLPHLTRSICIPYLLFNNLFFHFTYFPLPFFIFVILSPFFSDSFPFRLFPLLSFVFFFLFLLFYFYFYFLLLFQITNTNFT